MTDPANILASGRRVIAIERDALNQLSDELGTAFIDAVETCFNAAGRVVLTGVGKSGHVARKIASTMASTGTPSLYIHPTEASHGDLGMITSGDVIIALSRSGETKELSDMIAYSRRFSVPLVALTAIENSTLGRAADICLTIPNAPEACGETRAPTTSTTLSMALGDALAVAVLEQRGFTGDDFKVFHPGGKLGAMLRTVGDLMSGEADLPFCGQNTPLKEALTILSEGRLGCLIVLEADTTKAHSMPSGAQLAGMITDGDIRRLVTSRVTVSTIGEAMTRDPLTVEPETLASQALALMNDKRITQLIAVTPDNRPVGILHMHDLLKAGLV